MVSATPFLMFTNAAAEAMNFYASVLPDGMLEIGPITEYGADSKIGTPGMVQAGEMTVDGTRYIVADAPAGFTFGAAFSIMIQVDTQGEIDALWEALTADGGMELGGGWLTDRFGMTWQVIPRNLLPMMTAGGAPTDRVFGAIIGMKKLVIADLEAAFNGDGDGDGGAEEAA